MPTIKVMLEKIEGLSGTHDLTPWENEFIESVLYHYNYHERKKTSFISEKQLAIIERIYAKHFC